MLGNHKTKCLDPDVRRPVLVKKCSSNALLRRDTLVLRSAGYPSYLTINTVLISHESRRIRWPGHVARMEDGRGVHRVLVRKPEGKRPLGRPRRSWEDNIKMDGVQTSWSSLRIGTDGGHL